MYREFRNAIELICKKTYSEVGEKQMKEYINRIILDDEFWESIDRGISKTHDKEVEISRKIQECIDELNKRFKLVLEMDLSKEEIEKIFDEMHDILDKAEELALSRYE